jgi:UDP-N-acetylmuramate dehydrogenase
MINSDNASALDLEQLGETVRKRVFEHCGTMLRWEIRRIGTFKEGQSITPAENI